MRVCIISSGPAESHGPLNFLGSAVDHDPSQTSTPLLLPNDLFLHIRTHLLLITLQYLDEMVTSGPYNVSEYVAGEFIELALNPNYFFGVEHSTPSTGPSTTEVPPPDLTMAIIVGALGAAMVVLIGGYAILRIR